MNEGFAGPDAGDSDPWSPLARFRVRVCRFWAAWRTQTLDRLLGPGNRHNATVQLDGIVPPSDHVDKGILAVAPCRLARLLRRRGRRPPRWERRTEG